jgi:hypothetical protein
MSTVNTQTVLRYTYGYYVKISILNTKYIVEKSKLANIY